MYGLRPGMTSYLKESLSVSIGCYGQTLMQPMVLSSATKVQDARKKIARNL